MSDASPMDFPFSREEFREGFPEIRRLVLEEWPNLDAEALDATEGRVDAVLELVVSATQHSRVLVRKHLAEIAEVAGVQANGIEERLVRLLHYLEDKAEPVGREAQRLASDVRDRGEQVGRQVATKVHDAEDTMKDNLWVSLMAALGLGLVAGLIVGLTRGR